MKVVVPRVNTNEDQLEVVRVLVENGQTVAAGELLFIMESTKTAVDIVAPAAGSVAGISVVVGDFVDVGQLVCTVAATDAQTVAQPFESASSVSPPAEAKVTAKAALLARSHGIDVARIPPNNGVVGVKEVETWLRSAAHTTPGALMVPSEGRSGNRAVMVGGGSHAAVILDAIAGSAWEIVGCTDPKLPAGETVVRGVATIGSDSILDQLLTEGVRYAFVGVGGATDNTLRKSVFEMLIDKGFLLPPLVHASARVGLDTTLGPATYVLPGASIGPRNRIGANVIVNTGAVVCHDCVIGDHAHLTPSATLAGNVSIGAESTIGMGASVLFGVSIGYRCLVHNNASVVADLPDGSQVNHAGRVSRRR